MSFLQIEDAKSLGALITLITTMSTTIPIKSVTDVYAIVAPPPNHHCTTTHSNTFIEVCSHKITRQIEDLEKVSGILGSSFSVDGVPVDSILPNLYVMRRSDDLK
ncbi:hypothetical protein Tco_1489306, partial [Tanacetum coccineum]